LYERCKFSINHIDIGHLYLIFSILGVIFMIFLITSVVYADEGTLENVISSAKKIKIDSNQSFFTESSKNERKIVGGIAVGFGMSLVVLFSGGAGITAAVVFVVVTAATIASVDLL